LFDVIIIGGGAAGLSTSIMIKNLCKDLNVAIIEQIDRVGKKISVTGNGRCNITNKSIAANNYYSCNKDNALKILNGFDLNKTKDFFSSIGVEISFENNKAYPRSFQASSVVDALRFSATNLGVHLLTSTKVVKITNKNNTFNILAENSENKEIILKSNTVVIATGGMAGGSKLGCNGDGYKFLKNFGHNIIPQSPVIVQVKTENSLTKSLKGIKVNANVKVVKGSAIIATDFGEVLFCDYGLSGPPVLQLSRYCANGTSVILDLFDEISLDDLTTLISNRRSIFKGFPLTEFFAGLLHKRIGQAILKDCNLQLSSTCETLTEYDCKKIANKLKNFVFKVTGNTGFVNAQATSGGADLKDFDDKLMSKKCKGLFAVGEVLDVDGDCGGYNLQWAWSSAYTVSDAIASFVEMKK
jgi:predicted Rossmann fold flavoprotein